jgi:hypothetical protein
MADGENGWWNTAAGVRRVLSLSRSTKKDLSSEFGQETSGRAGGSREPVLAAGGGLVQHPPQRLLPEEDVAARQQREVSTYGFTIVSCISRRVPGPRQHSPFRSFCSRRNSCIRRRSRANGRNNNALWRTGDSRHGPQWLQHYHAKPPLLKWRGWRHRESRLDVWRRTYNNLYKLSQLCLWLQLNVMALWYENASS